MKVLIAEDDPISRFMLEASLKRWGYEVLVTTNGREAWDALQQEDTPQLAILDWMMPGMDGVQVCRRARQTAATRGVYILLLTAKGEKDDIIAGLEAGANDYVAKPFDRAELRARVQVGVRMVELQQSLSHRVRELVEALSQVKQLQGILPICAHCKKVRDDHDYWQQVEGYISAHTEVQFSHSICPQCYETIVVPQIERLSSPEKKEEAIGL
ncbi:MAG: response regulator [Acidobacteriota bacterium]